MRRRHACGLFCRRVDSAIPGPPAAQRLEQPTPFISNPPTQSTLSQAADILAQLGASGAAAKLMGMSPDARSSIIESMAPRDAAVTLVSMEDALQVGSSR